METTLNPHVAIQYDDPSDRELLIKHTEQSTPRDELLEKWDQLLISNPIESKVQTFLEHFPYFLPGLYDLHNGPRRGIIISKLPFGADYESDFAFVTLNSMMLQFTFVEIERPNKRIFNEDSSFTQDFNHAFQQIKDWKIWAEKNIDSLVNIYADLFQNYNISNDHKTIKCYLVCGRREEVISPQLQKERWSSLEASNDKSIEVMTYDRLTAPIATFPSDHIRHNIAVCRYKKRGFYLLADRLKST